ncbi:MAG: YihY/virulence factor BrkB family protein [Candidatus Bathyarchaeota archaeon]|nr:YihY/virulence factor BrkB family protein [Candidatus Bathyarchaeota archaeon]
MKILLETYSRWQKHDATLRAAALAFFIILPLPSLALIGVAVFAQFYGQEQALAQLISQVSTLVGPAVAALLEDLLTNAQSPLTSIIGSFFSIVFAISGAVGAFSVLQKSIDVIWEIHPKRGIAESIKAKLVPFAAIIGLGLLVVAWTAFSTVLSDAAIALFSSLLGRFPTLLLRLLEVVLSFVLATLLFAVVFKTLPETEVQWRDVWVAAAITGLVFTLLNSFFGLYLSLFYINTLAGTAGSLIVLFLWIYITALFVLFGAQFSKVYAQTFGSYKNKPLTPKKRETEPIDHVEMKAEVKVKVIPDRN